MGKWLEWIGLRLRRPLYRNSILLASSRFLAIAAGFAFWVVAARYYSVADVGVAAALISLLGLVMLFSRLGLDFSIIRFLPVENKRQVFGTVLTITTIASAVSAIICIPVFGLASPGLSALLNPTYALLFLIFTLTNSVVAISGNAFIAMRQGGQYLFQNAVIVSRIPLLIPLVFLGGYGIFSSVGLAYLIAAVLALIFIDKSIGVGFSIDRPFIKKSFSFSLGSYASSILSNAPVLVMPILVLSLAGEAEAAKYYIAFAVGHLVLIIPDSFSTTLFVEGSHGESLRKTVKTTAIAIYSLLIPAIAFIYLFGDMLLGFIGEEYKEASQLLTLIALSAMVYAVCSLFISIQNVRMRIASVVRLNVLRSSLLLASSCYFVIVHGIIGIGYAWLLTYGVVSAVIGILAKKEGWI